MARIPNLDNARVNLSSLREQSQKELFNLLKSVGGNKCLVIDPKLAGTLSLMIKASLFKENGVEFRHLNGEPVQTKCSKIIYLVRSQLTLMKIISSHIHNDLSKGVEREYFVYFVPRRTLVCEQIFEEEKVHSLLTFGEYPLFLLPLDEDVISFELDLAYKEIVVDGDTSSLWHVANAIHNLELSFGVIPHVRAKGKASTKIADILNNLQVEDPVNADDMVMPEIDTLILLDREVDMVTPMCCQLTYEGLLDEILQINNGVVEVDSNIMNGKQEGQRDGNKKIKVSLNSSDKLYQEIRDLNFGVVLQVLHQKATSIQHGYVEIKSPSQSSFELKDFVEKLSSKPEIERHVNLAKHLLSFNCKTLFHARRIEQKILELQNYEDCIEYIEEMIYKQEPLVNVLRLLVLFSLTNSGLLKKNFDDLRREILHSYGFEHMTTLYNLEKAGLFKKQESRSNWLTISRALQLIVNDTDTTNPKDISDMFFGYAPLSIRLVQHAIKSGWHSVKEVIKFLPGPHFDIERDVSNSSFSLEANAISQPNGNIDRVSDGHRSLALVIFVGGVTFAEIAALRFLSSQEGTGYDFIIGATIVVNGNSILETLVTNNN